MPGTVAPDRVLRERYRLTREIAQGGMATVWEARDAVLDRPVAVKVLHPHLAADDEFVARFRREAVAAAGLAHPNIVCTYDTGSEDGIDFIVMELVDGKSLRDLLDHGPVPTPVQALTITACVADALAYAQSRGIVHRDVKPANVLIRADGQVKVTDFGIAKADDGHHLTKTGEILGTVAYLAPEQVDGRGTDSRADVYSLGIVLYEMLTGRPPFEGTNDLATATARLLEEPPAPSEIRPGLQPGVDAAVACALARDPQDRFQSATDFAAALRDLMAGEDETPAAGSPRVLAAPGWRAGRIRTRRAARQTGDGALPAGGRARTTRPAVAFTLVAGITAALAALLIASRADVPLLGSSSDPVTSLAITSAADFDPGGRDRHEHPEQVRFVIDGNAATAWNTERYVSRDFGVKPGVGIVLRLEQAAKLRRIEIDAQSGDWAGSIYVSEAAADTLEGWGAPAAKFTAANPHPVITLDHPAAGRFVLVWITQLPPARSLAVDEVRVAA